jgi:ribosomal RNA-processing protein 9
LDIFLFFNLADVGAFDARDIDRDLIAERLQDDALEAKGKLFHQIAKKFAEVDFSDPSRIRTFYDRNKSHHLPLTSLAVAFPTEGRTGR